MEQSTINQRLKFLLDSFKLSARAFSEVIGESATNTQNYVGARNAEPRAGYIQKVLDHFSSVNAQWLMTGRGAPFLPDSDQANEPFIIYQKNKSSVGTNHGSISHTGQNSSAALEQEVTGLRIQVEALQQQLATTKALLAAKDDIIAAKEEMLTLLRGQHNRPN